MEIKLDFEQFQFVIDVDTLGKARLVHFSPLPFVREKFLENRYHTVAEIHCLGDDIDDHHGQRHTYMCPGAELKYVEHCIADTENGKILKLCLKNEKIMLVQNYRFYNGCNVVQCYNSVTNISHEEQTLLYDSSFAFYGLCNADDTDWGKDVCVYVPHNTWHCEAQCVKYTLSELGINMQPRGSLKKVDFSSVGGWSTGEYIPMGIVENTRNKTSLFWQIEHNGSWVCEMASVRDGGPYIQLGGPNFDNHHFKKTLKPDETFESVKVAVGVTCGGFDESVAQLTKYRRLIRRKNADNINLPVIFNDYMNCLMGDPDEQKELPMIDAAADMGCEYYVIDAGWFYDGIGGDDDWWPVLGEFEEASSRFPRGLKFVIDYIRDKGMVAGLWLELETVGVKSRLAKEAPDDWFFMHGGKRVMQHNRYQLDFRNPSVRRRADEIISKIVDYYGCGYIKLDYNLNSGLGTDLNCESLGLGLLEHNRAYLDWLDSVFEKYPDIIIENCASGGQRMDYACLSRLSIQSVSDQTDIGLLTAITSMVSMAVTPEQMAIWSYPAKDSDEEETILNMANAMLGRIHQSGFIHKLSPQNTARIKEGITCYKRIRDDIKNSVPFYPLGLICIDSPWNVNAVKTDKKAYVTVIRKDTSDDTVKMPLNGVPANAKLTCIYPVGADCCAAWNGTEHTLNVKLDKNTARVFCLDF